MYFSWDPEANQAGCDDNADSTNSIAKFPPVSCSSVSSPYVTVTVRSPEASADWPCTFIPMPLVQKSTVLSNSGRSTLSVMRCRNLLSPDFTALLVASTNTLFFSKRSISDSKKYLSPSLSRSSGLASRSLLIPSSVLRHWVRLVQGCRRSGLKPASASPVPSRTTAAASAPSTPRRESLPKGLLATAAVSES
eukprot:314723-Prorocentrum_minimum.AAC.5